MEPRSSRYASLDAWRAVAAAGVVIYHRAWGTSPFLHPGRLGVQIFFVISGYCLAAALDRSVATGMSWSTFMKRRFRRIAPPYLASVALALVSEVVQLGWYKLDKPWNVYVQNATLTQWLTVSKGYLQATRPATLVPWANPSLLLAPYWSLDYEEQFYIIMGLSLALAAIARPARTLVAVTALAAFVNWLRPEAVTGLFTDYWLEFACGLLLHHRAVHATPDRARLVDGALVLGFVFCAAQASYRGELDVFSFEHRYRYFGHLALTSGFAIVLVVLHRFDAAIAKARVMRPLMALGGMSYSLYLIHLPVFNCLGFLDRVRIPVVRESLALGILLAATWAFHRVFERPFLNTKPT